VLFSGFSTARRVLSATFEPPGPRQHPPPCDYVCLGVDGFYTCCSCTLRDDNDDFEAYSTAAIIDHRHEHQAAGHHIPADAFDDLHADAAGNDVWIKPAGKDCRSRPQEPTLADVLAEVRVLQQGFDGLHQDFRDHRAAIKVRKIDTTRRSKSPRDVTRTGPLCLGDAGLWPAVLPRSSDEPPPHRGNRGQGRADTCAAAVRDVSVRDPSATSPY
jgi:hypothetical protein